MVFGRVLRVWLVLLALAVAVFAADVAFAHGGARDVLTVDSAYAGDKASLVEHCHNGPLCSGVVGFDSFRPAFQIRSRVLTSARLHSLLQPYDLLGFDPPPPRILF